MTNSDITKRFFTVTDLKTKASILESIAAYYGITSEEAEAEVTDCEAESLLDYLIGSVRSATHLLMKRHGLA